MESSKKPFYAGAEGQPTAIAEAKNVLMEAFAEQEKFALKLRDDKKTIEVFRLKDIAIELNCLNATYIDNGIEYSISKRIFSKALKGLAREDLVRVVRSSRIKNKGRLEERVIRKYVCGLTELGRKYANSENSGLNTGWDRS